MGTLMWNFVRELNLFIGHAKESHNSSNPAKRSRPKFHLTITRGKAKEANADCIASFMIRCHVLLLPYEVDFISLSRPSTQEPLRSIIPHFRKLLFPQNHLHDTMEK